MTEAKKGKEPASENRRHRFFWRLLKPIAFLLTRSKFNYHYEKIKNIQEPFILLSNHVTDWDPLMVGLSLDTQAYFVASEHITRFSLFGLIKWIFDPIIRFKGTVGAITVKDILRKIRDRKNVILFPEGVRTMDGVTMPILPSTGKLIKRSGAAMITYRLRGGYFSSPNWSEGKVRKGMMKGAPVRVVSSEEISRMTVEQINDMINEDLFVDAYRDQEESPVAYRGGNLAECLENILFTCPQCEKLNTMRSQGDMVTCSECGYTAVYDEFGKLTGTFTSVKDWAAWQRKVTSRKAASGEKLMARGKLYTIVKRKKKLLTDGEIVLTRDTLSINETALSLDDIPEMEIHGRHELVFSAGRDYYELEVDKPYSASSFLWFYNAHKNL